MNMDDQVVKMLDASNKMAGWVRTILAQIALMFLVPMVFLVIAVAALFMPRTVIETMERVIGREYLRKQRKKAIESSEVIVVCGDGVNLKAYTDRQRRNPKLH